MNQSPAGATGYARPENVVYATRTAVDLTNTLRVPTGRAVRHRGRGVWSGPSRRASQVCHARKPSAASTRKINHPTPLRRRIIPPTRQTTRPQVPRPRFASRGAETEHALCKGGSASENAPQRGTIIFARPAEQTSLLRGRRVFARPRRTDLHSPCCAASPQPQRSRRVMRADPLNLTRANNRPDSFTTLRKHNPATRRSRPNCGPSRAPASNTRS